ncbi:hypothetical protein [Brachybacterium sp. GCM10030252]|uniref:hypothetical protein n=1 Tax=Brachybacterium sp. GCM10030252 TaxID=3273380 RepID=UPI003617ECB7
MSTPMNNSLPWPTEAPVLPVLSVRPVLDRIDSLARTHEQDVTLIPGLAMTEEEVAADPPPALEQVADELGGIELCGQRVLTLQIEDRTDVGPYTLLGEATSFYPLYETPDAAVILTIDPDGAPGAVYGIGEDLALYLAAPNLGGYLERFADALEATLNALAERDDEGEARTEAAEQLMEGHLFAEILGTDETADPVEVPLQAPATTDIVDLPGHAVAVADLREAPRGARVDLIDADVPGDPLDLHVIWRERGRIVVLAG